MLYPGAENFFIPDSGSKSFFISDAGSRIPRLFFLAAYSFSLKSSTVHKDNKTKILKIIIENFTKKRGRIRDPRSVKNSSRIRICNTNQYHPLWHRWNFSLHCHRLQPYTIGSVSDPHWLMRSQCFCVGGRTFNPSNTGTGTSCFRYYRYLVESAR
jgi:hypothetical protein